MNLTLNAFLKMEVLTKTNRVLFSLYCANVEFNFFLFHYFMEIGKWTNYKAKHNKKPWQ
jgi:hypothetical protein